MRKSARFLAVVLILATLPAVAARRSAPVSYTVSLANAAEHLCRVTLTLGPGEARQQVQLPVWNALYQVRDFAQYVGAVKAKNAAGEPLPVRKLDKTTWEISGANNGGTVEYDIIADLPGPFGAQLNAEHAFFNLAEILMYPVGGRDAAMTVAFQNIPDGWRIATPLPANPGGPATFTARNYDHLVDSPVEIGEFQEVTFQEGGATYRVIAHGNPGDYDLKAIAESLRKIVGSAVDWMHDRPFEQYMFIYHLPKGPAGGGMEHAYSTAIDVSASALSHGLAPLENVSAHEFLHLWNVKRIRPASLEPIDYTRENYTRALWFSEGVDSAATEYVLLQAGLTDEPSFLKHFAGQIRELQRRPAHLTQSVEESSLDAWLEKYSPYNQPQRSVNYYNKGELLGFLLDLTVRQASNDRASLRDVFQWMNQHFAKQGRLFPDTAGVEEAAEAVSGAKLDGFFQKYVAGVEELPYDELLKTVGLALDRRKVAVAAPGFAMAFNGDAPAVYSVEAGSNAGRAGLREGDVILSLNDAPIGRGRRSAMAQMSPGDPVRLKVRNREGAEREINFKMGSREDDAYVLVDLDNVTAAQRARRKLWLSSQDQAAQKAAGQ